MTSAGHFSPAVMTGILSVEMARATGTAGDSAIGDYRWYAAMLARVILSIKLRNLKIRQ